MAPAPTAHAGEFGLIAQHFQRARALHYASLGIGDDAALLPALPAGEQLAISTDMLVQGRHFFADAPPATLGHKALAVNLSDMAAMGAQPLGFTLALALPQRDDAWLAAFAHGLFALADAHRCDLLGGDTTRGPLNICITIWGRCPRGQALLRSGAHVGDDIWVSHGQRRSTASSLQGREGLGDARLALHLLQCQRGTPPAASTAAEHAVVQHLLHMSAQQQAHMLAATRYRLEQPCPRTALGQALRTMASACADISDGLAGDLQHILHASGTGATLFASRDPSSPQPADGDKNSDKTNSDKSSTGGTGSGNDSHHNGCGLLHAASAPLRAIDPEAALHYALAGGDDYELLFTAAPQQRAAVAQAAHQTNTCISRIGTITAAPGLRLHTLHGHLETIRTASFTHF